MADNVVLGWWVLVLGVLAAFVYSLYQRNFGAVIGWVLAIGGGLFLYGQIEKLHSHGLGIKETILHSSWNVRKKDDGRLVLGPFSFNDSSTPWLWTSLEPGRYRIEVRGTVSVCSDCPRSPLKRVSPNGVPGLPAISGSFPFPKATPLALIAQMRESGEVLEIGSRADLSISAPRNVGFSMNDDVLEDNGGEGWTIVITPY